jgi:hypothetical protein
MDSRISYAEEEWIWWGHTIASRRRASGGVLPRGEKRMAKGKNLRPGTPFIVGGERDDAEPGPHVGDGEPTVSRLAEQWHGASTPPLVGHVRTRSLFNHRPGPLFHRDGANSLKQKFFYYSNLLRFVYFQINHS